MAKVEASQDAHGTGAESGGDRQPPVGASRWRQYPELATIEPAGLGHRRAREPRHRTPAVEPQILPDN